MSNSLGLVLPRIIDATWRRRYLLIIPIVLMIPVSIAASVLLPGGYMARSLMLLQETVGANPLAKDPTALPSDRMRERIAALRALLASDFVLSGALDKMGEQTAYGSKERALKIQDLRTAASVDLIGGDLLEFRLRGNEAEGLGRQLEIVTTSLMETLIAHRGRSVGEMLVSHRKQELEAAEQANAALKRRKAAAEAAGVQIAGLETQISDSDNAVQLAREDYDASRKQYNSAAANRSVNLFTAPENIMVIDPPKDPSFRTRRRLYMILSGVFGGLLLGVGLAILAELLDRTIRYPDQLVKLTGVPIVARLPRSEK